MNLEMTILKINIFRRPTVTLAWTMSASLTTASLAHPGLLHESANV